MQLSLLLLRGARMLGLYSAGLHDARTIGAMFLACMLLILMLLCARRAPRSRRPAVVWGVGGYFMLLHAIGIYGLLTSTQFETALAMLTLATFPWCAILTEVIDMQSFATFHELGANYIRYYLVFGGLNAVLVAVFFALLVRPRPGRTLLSR